MWFLGFWNWFIAGTRKRFYFVCAKLLSIEQMEKGHPCRSLEDRNVKRNTGCGDLDPEVSLGKWSFLGLRELEDQRSPLFSLPGYQLQWQEKHCGRPGLHFGNPMKWELQTQMVLHTVCTYGTEGDTVSFLHKSRHPSGTARSLNYYFFLSNGVSSFINCKGRQ